MRLWTRLQLPATRMSPPGSAFSLAISPATSPRITSLFSQVASSSVSVVETTNLRMLFIFWAKPTSSVIDGHALANPW